MFAWPYYWWEAGAAWGSMLDYWYYTGDDTWNDVLKTSLLFQIGTNWDYIPSNQSTTEGNDDQAFWGITVMAAAEKTFPTLKVTILLGLIWPKLSSTQWHGAGIPVTVVVA